MSTMTACAMEDDESNEIDKAYTEYLQKCQTIGLQPMSEFYWINGKMIGM